MNAIYNDVSIDLHVHSSYSDKPFSWFLRSAGSAECYTSPETVYQTAMRRGMDLVTLTDHDTIAGALELAARHDNVFISEEISARFPEDGCIVHIIALDISEAQHQELQRLRRNIYELVTYMDGEEIAHFWCHPLSDVNHRLTRSHLERCFLMFRALELRNGTRDQVHENRLLDLVERMTPALLGRWAEKNPQTPPINLDSLYAFTGGSDDHGGIAIARAFTRFAGDASGVGLRAALKARQTRPSGQAGTGTTLAHNCYGVSAGFFRASGQLGGAAQKSNGASVSGGNNDDQLGLSVSLLSLLSDRKRRLEDAGGQFSVDDLVAHGHTSSYQDRLYDQAGSALVSGWRHSLSSLGDSLGKGRIAEAADAVADTIKALLLELPYVLAHRWHVRDRDAATRLCQELELNRPDSSGLRVAILTDTIDEIDGVAIGLRRLHAEAARWGVQLDLVSTDQCENAHYDDDGIYRLPSVYEHRLAEYPQYAWKVPHLPALLRYVSDRRIDLLQCSTPGPVGLAGLLAGRLTGIPVIGQFHTDVPEYTLRLTGDPTVTAIMRSFVAWFYRNMDRTLVPSDWVADTMIDLGVPRGKISRIPRGIDLDRFSPQLRDERAFARYGLGGEPKLLYVGRMSREKGLDHLAAGFSLLSEVMPSARLVMVGDGPFAAEFAAMTPADKVVFTGPIKGEELARLYASGDVFISPSETETFGNTVVEAQASGLPVIVADRGAACENMRDGVTGLVVDPKNPRKLCWALEHLLQSHELRYQMSFRAHQFAQRYNMADALRGTFREYVRALFGEPTGGDHAAATEPVRAA
ncbi:MAG: glycosyltransferase [Proteobacteria bacterium]|nr:glycosyltransferase [Pseudomonadota bacterium]